MIVQLNNTWCNTPIYSVPAEIGYYSATVKFERRTAPFTWQTVGTYVTNAIQAQQTTASPSFTINGIAPTQGVPITTCASSVIMNASATSCEYNYFLEVVETDQWGNLTNAFGWSHWYAGQAPASIDLQQLSLSFANQKMISGNLPNGTPRYYRVKLATNDPVWISMETFLRIENSNPEFNINGVPTANGQTFSNLCQYDIIMNAAATSCEDSFQVEIVETNQAGTATGQYGWSKAFPGQAPDNLDLQSLCVQYSIPPYYTGISGRQGTTMISGNLANGSPRYYKATLSTSLPANAAKYVMLRVSTTPCRVANPELYANHSLQLPQSQATADEIAIFPNPAHAQFTLQIRSAIGGQGSITILDATGKEMLHRDVELTEGQLSEWQLDRTEGMATGMYFVRIQSPKATTTKKLVLE
ncbi:MAG: T9SS type A sorting domain-containing protein [Bacteroidia bacterium]